MYTLKDLEDVSGIFVLQLVYDHGSLLPVPLSLTTGMSTIFSCPKYTFFFFPFCSWSHCKKEQQLLTSMLQPELRCLEISIKTSGSSASHKVSRHQHRKANVLFLLLLVFCHDVTIQFPTEFSSPSEILSACFLSFLFLKLSGVASPFQNYL